MEAWRWAVRSRVNHARRSGERSGERSSEPALYYISCTHRPHYALYGTVGGGGLAGGVIRRRRGEMIRGAGSEGAQGRGLTSAERLHREAGSMPTTGFTPLAR